MATYAFSDIHGVYALWAAIRDYCQPDDTIYFLGDASDRGPNGVKIIQELLNDKRVIYIKGNHEFILEWFFNKPSLEKFDFWTKNGGGPTQEALTKLSDDELHNLIACIELLPFWATYENPYTKQKIFMSHSGYYCSLDEYAADPAKCEMELLEHRDWDKEEKPAPAHIDYIVHGHTPVQYFYDSPATIAPYFYQKHKIDIDCCSVYSGKVILFNLDNFTHKIFTIQDNK